MFDKLITEQDRIDAQSVLEEFPAVKSEIDDVFFGGDEQAVVWLTTPVPILDGLTPVEVIREGYLDSVLDILRQMRTGDFS